MTSPESSESENAATGNGGTPAYLRQYAAILALLYLALVVATVHARNYHGLIMPDSMRYADLARNFIQGEGFVSNAVLPHNVLQLTYDKRTPARLIRTPHRQYYGFPLVLAAFFALMGPTEVAVFVAASALWILGGMLVFFLARRLFDDRAAAIAVFLYSVQPKLIAYAIAGLSEPLCVVLMTGAALAVVAEKRVIAGGLTAGALAALAFVVRQPMLFLMPIVLIGALAWRTDRRWLSAGAMVGGIVAGKLALAALQPVFFPPPEPFDAIPVTRPTTAVSTAAPSASADDPWWARKLHGIFGTAAYVFSSQYPGHSVERSADAAPAAKMSTGELFREKLRINAPKVLTSATIRLGTPFLGLIFLFSVLYRWRDRRVAIAALTAAALIGATGFVTLWLYVMERYFQIFVPWLILPIAAAVAHLTQTQEGGSRRQRVVLAVLLIWTASIPIRSGILPWPASDPLIADIPRDTRDVKSAVADILKEHTDPEDIVFCDLPLVSAWYADRTSIWLPLKFSDVYEIARWVDADYLMLTLEDPEGYQTWAEWLMFKRGDAIQHPKLLGPWEFVAGRNTKKKSVILFRNTQPTVGGVGSVLTGTT
ncbi:glycosyltransferase family 39 protein [bacterium]|nr:glycosyltransferase family 39 protein [bacterium]